MQRVINYDPISQTYSLEERWERRPEEAQTIRFSSKRSLMRYVHTVATVPLTFLSFQEHEYVNSQRSYVSVRVHSHCHGEYNETLAAISQVISLGQIELSGFDTGWNDFRLRGRTTAR